MPFRLRMALWIGGVSILGIGLTVLASLAVHGRTHYDELDRALAADAAHFEAFLLALGKTPDEFPTAGLHSVGVRFYDREGAPVAPRDRGEGSPPLGALEVIARDEGPPYGPPLSWWPRGGHMEQGWFATTRDRESGERLRIYVQRFAGLPGDVAYVQTWASLGSLDRSIERFRFLMGGFGLAAVAAASAGAFLAARRVLAPIGTLTQTARAIASSRAFSRRVPERPEQDEMGQLARTLNEMLRSLEEAHESQRQFVADAAHELRAPLAAMRANLHVLRELESQAGREQSPDTVESAREGPEALAFLEREAARLSALADELLTLARADSGQEINQRPVDLDALVLSVVADLGRRPAGLKPTVVGVEPVRVRGDELRLRQLLTILLDNALRYTPADGAVSIGLRHDEGDAVLEVTDSGIGIAESDLPHIFDRFYRAEAARARFADGAGLGLAIARWVVEAHGGEIEVESKPGAGTSVTVRLPA